MAPDAVRTFYPGDDLAEIRTEEILEFLVCKEYGRASKRHFRELFHELFQVALKTGNYVPDNAHAANPADELPTFKGTDKPVTVLTRGDEENLYLAALRTHFASASELV